MNTSPKIRVTVSNIFLPVKQKFFCLTINIASKLICVGCLLLSTICLNYGALAAPDKPSDDDIFQYTVIDDKTDKPTAKNEDIVNLDSIQGLKVISDVSVWFKEYDRAIDMAKRAIAKDKDDVDLHRVYADALEHKLNKQADPDPELFNTCVKEWLIVFHNEVGDEKGMEWHGVAIPLVERFYEDEDRTIAARKSLLSLTGTLPKQWETDTKFLKRVCKSTMSVQGKVLPKTNTPDSPSLNVPMK